MTGAGKVAVGSVGFLVVDVLIIAVLIVWLKDWWRTRERREVGGWYE